MTSVPTEDPDPEPRVRRRRPEARRDRGVARIWLIAAIAVLALVAWAATSIGERPDLERDSQPSPDRTTAHDDAAANRDAVNGDADPTAGSTETTASPPDDSGTLFTPDAPVMASAGCADPGGESSITDAELRLDGSLRARYSLNAPTEGDPAPLVVLISEAGLPAAELAASSGVFDVTPGWVQIAVDPLSDPGSFGEAAVPELLETVIGSQCVDLNRVFLVGFGEGGRAAGAAVCTAPELMSGVAMVAGWTQPECSPDPRVAARIIGADDDPSVGTGTALEEVGGTWAQALGAGDQIVEGRDEDTLVRLWSGPGGVTVETTATVGGGHTWTVAASLAVGSLLRDTARTLG